ncbi:GNAT family N-acetyltransferase [Fictibacillus nanhaiensis]|uniref:GNAT family N-acetyltransferase n=1 Tax=Fictibacillus nanhaiensis TaxID=742169 RepID=UPI001C96BA0A|nr:GNAT family N-acetyltransferase [Fictibacillus nanhaiensis]MBY6035976.1 GNAT family N-acetyltransferase [Fictibacillus nanhaiensis]
MNIKVEKASIEQKTVLRNLLELYKYDFTEFDPEDVNDEGVYGYKYFDHYWIEPERFPFLIRVNEKYAGFALVRKMSLDEISMESHYSMAEFFVMKKYRKCGLGKKAAFYLFDLFPGKWEVAQMEENIPAQQFWMKVISNYTNENFTELRKKDWEGPIQTFYSCKNMA